MKAQSKVEYSPPHTAKFPVRERERERERDHTYIVDECREGLYKYYRVALIFVIRPHPTCNLCNELS